ncbi:hypothetical protein ALQ80_03669 [Pseudomonas coronafaciens pv. oryzae]|nr:Uncharacterized protein ALO66_02693 [Pseudomonas coronafaciens pv. atropurpurea]RMM35081.1 hypothetical protein ALQ80_03669 [Pseudomonas coronafaciens pv. oryzae]RMT63592.1 hypothetical protein ALP45_04321 [Pseudomonas coronafaciens pv. atropurpurea]
MLQAIDCARFGRSHLEKHPPSAINDSVKGSMREILKFFVLLIAVCITAIATSLLLPSPDGVVFACSVLLSAIALNLIICRDLSKGRINQAGDIMRAIERRESTRLTIAAYLLGCSMVASVAVLVYRLLVH